MVWSEKLHWWDKSSGKVKTKDRLGQEQIHFNYPPREYLCLQQPLLLIIRLRGILISAAIRQGCCFKMLTQEPREALMALHSNSKHPEVQSQRVLTKLEIILSSYCPQAKISLLWIWSQMKEMTSKYKGEISASGDVEHGLNLLHRIWEKQTMSAQVLSPTRTASTVGWSSRMRLNGILISLWNTLWQSVYRRQALLFLPKEANSESVTRESGILVTPDSWYF